MEGGSICSPSTRSSIRKDGWYFGRSARYCDKEELRGPVPQYQLGNARHPPAPEAGDRQAGCRGTQQKADMAPAFIVIDGKGYSWKDILKLRREQTKTGEAT